MDGILCNETVHTYRSPNLLVIHRGRSGPSRQTESAKANPTTETLTISVRKRKYSDRHLRCSAVYVVYGARGKGFVRPTHYYHIAVHFHISGGKAFISTSPSNRTFSHVPLAWHNTRQSRRESGSSPRYAGDHSWQSARSQLLSRGGHGTQRRRR